MANVRRKNDEKKTENRDLQFVLIAGNSVVEHNSVIKRNRNDIPFNSNTVHYFMDAHASSSIDLENVPNSFSHHLM